jgi:hypothetical protein
MAGNDAAIIKSTAQWVFAEKKGRTLKYLRGLIQDIFCKISFIYNVYMHIYQFAVTVIVNVDVFSFLDHFGRF